MLHNIPNVPAATDAASAPTYPCVETGTFTPVPLLPQLVLNYGAVNSAMNGQILKAGTMTFQMTGCAGDPNNPAQGLCVGEGMAAQIANPPAGASVPAFFYHLGDITYKHGDPTDDTTPAADLGTLWNNQFYKQYTSYQYPASGGNPATPAPIFAIAGNHDAKTSSHSEKDEIGHFLTNFCGTWGVVSQDNQTGDGRTEMYQPYPYWLLETPLAYIIGLYTNDTNGGLLDDPHLYHDPTQGPQFAWLVAQLSWIKQQNSQAGTSKAVLLTTHYPPFSGAANFAQRGDPTLGPTKGASHAVPLGMLLQQAYSQSGQIPDAVFSAHAHLYQRLTYTYDSASPTQQVPYLIVGTGGHVPTENLWNSCSGTPITPPALPMDIFAQKPPVVPSALTVPAGNTVLLENYFDASNAPAPTELPYGFLSITITAAPPAPSTAHAQLTGTFYSMAYSAEGITSDPIARDTFVLDLETHLLIS